MREEVDYLRTVLGNQAVDNHLSFQVYKGDGIWGLVDGLSMILKTQNGKGVSGIGRHEAVHYVLRNMIDPKSAQRIIDDVKRQIAKKRGIENHHDVSNKDAEEYLSEANRGEEKIEKTEQYKGLSGMVKQFINWIRELFTNTLYFGNEASRFLSDLNHGKFKDHETTNQGWGSGAAYFATISDLVGPEVLHNIYEGNNRFEIGKLINEFEGIHNYARARNLIRGQYVSHSKYSGGVDAKFSKQEVKDMQETLNHMYNMFKRSETDAYKKEGSYKELTQQYENDIPSAEQKKWYFTKLSNQETFRLLVKDVLPKMEITAEITESNTIHFEVPNSFHVDTYLHNNASLFLEAIPRHIVNSRGDLEQVRDPINPYLNSLTLNQIMRNELAGINLSEEGGLENAISRLRMRYNELLQSSKVEDGKINKYENSTTLDYIGSFLAAFGAFSPNAQLNVRKTRMRRHGRNYKNPTGRTFYSHYEMTWGLNEVAKAHNIDMTDINNPDYKKLMEMSKASSDVLTSILNHFTNTADRNFYTLKTETDRDGTTTDDLSVRLSGNYNDNYNRIRRSIKSRVYSDDYDINDTFKSKLKGHHVGDYVIDSEGVSIRRGKNDTEQLLVINDKGKFEFTSDVDSKMFKKLLADVGITVSYKQANFMLRNVEKYGMKRTTSFNSSDAANMIGHMLYIMKTHGDGQSLDNPKGNLVAEKAAGYVENMADNFKAEKDFFTVDQLADDLKGFSRWISDLNVIISNNFTTLNDGSKRYNTTQNTGYTRYISNTKADAGIKTHISDVARQVQRNNASHYFINPQGKVFDPFINGPLTVYEVGDFTVMTDGFNAEKTSKLGHADFQKASMSIFFNSALGKRINDGWKVLLNSHGDSNTIPIASVGTGRGWNETLFYVDKRDGKKSVRFSPEGIEAIFTPMYQKVLHHHNTTIKKLIDSGREGFLNKATRDKLSTYYEEINNALNQDNLSIPDAYERAMKLLGEKFNHKGTWDEHIRRIKLLNKMDLVEGVDFLKYREAGTDNFGIEIIKDGQNTGRPNVMGKDDILNIHQARKFIRALKSEDATVKWLNDAFKARARNLLVNANTDRVKLPAEYLASDNFTTKKGNNSLVFSRDNVNPAVLAYLSSFFVTSESMDTLFHGNKNQERGASNHAKRRTKANNSGTTLSVVPENKKGFGITRKMPVIRIADTEKTWENLKEIFPDYMTEYNETDGVIFTNPLAMLFIANSTGNELSLVHRDDATIKSLGMGVNAADGLGNHVKAAEFVLNDDTRRMYRGYDKIMKMLLSGGKMPDGYSSKYLYDVYTEFMQDEGATVKDAMEHLHDVIIYHRFQNGVDLLEGAISRIEYGSTHKLNSGQWNLRSLEEIADDAANDNWNDILLSEVDYDNYIVILNHNMDLRKQEVTMASQALSQAILGNSQDAKDVTRISSDITKIMLQRAIKEFPADNREKFNQSYKNSSADAMNSYATAFTLIEKVVNPATSIQIPAFIGKTLPAYMKKFGRENINFKTFGYKLVQAPDYLARLYNIVDAEGNEVAVTWQDAKRHAAKTGVDPATLQEVRLDSFTFDPTQRKINTPEQIIMPLPNREVFGVPFGEKTSLNEMLTLNHAAGEFNVRQFVKKNSADYYNDMSDGIEALRNTIHGILLEEGGLDFIKNSFVGKAIAEMHTDKDGKLHQKEYERDIADWDLLANYFHRLLDNTLVTVLRTPTSNWAAAAPAEITEIAHDSKSTLYRTGKRFTLDDSDFDIDQLAALTKRYGDNHRVRVGQEGGNSLTGLKNQQNSKYFKAQMDPKNFDLVTMQMDTESVKKSIKKNSQNRFSYHNDPTTAAINNADALGGKAMVAHVANMINIFARIHRISPDARKKVLAGFEFINDPANENNKVNQIRTLSTIMQLALDNKNEPVISEFGLNEITSGTISAMIVEGMNAAEIQKFLSTADIKQIIKRALASNQMGEQTVSLYEAVDTEIRYLNNLNTDEGRKAFFGKGFEIISSDLKHLIEDAKNHAELVERGIENDDYDESQGFSTLRQKKAILAQYQEGATENTPLSELVKITDQGIRESLNKAVDGRLNMLNKIVKFKEFVNKGEVLHNISQFSYHQGIPAKEYDIYNAIKNYEMATGTTFESHASTKPEYIDKSKLFMNKEGYGQDQKYVSMSQDQINGELSAIFNPAFEKAGELLKESKTKDDTELSILTEGQTGVAQAVPSGFTYNGRDVRLYHNVPTMTFLADGSRIMANDQIESLKSTYSERGEQKLNVTVNNSKKNYSDNLKSLGDGADIIIDVSRSSQSTPSYRIAKSASPHTKGIRLNIAQQETEAMAEQIAKAISDVHNKKASADARDRSIAETEGESIADTEINILVVGENAFGLKKNVQTEYSFAMQRMNELKEIGNVREVVKGNPELRLYFNAFMDAYEGLYKNLIPFTPTVYKIIHERVLPKIKQAHFKFAGQYFAFTEALYAAILGFHYKYSNNKVYGDDLVEFIDGSTSERYFRRVLEGKTFNLGRYSHQVAFVMTFPQLAVDLKSSRNPSINKNVFINNLTFDNKGGKLTIKNHIFLDVNTKVKIKQSVLQLKESHYALYEAFVHYELLANGLHAKGYSLAEILDDNMYFGISESLDVISSDLAIETKYPTNKISKDIMKFLNSDNLVEKVASYNANVLLRLSKRKEMKGYTPDYIKRDYYLKNDFGKVVSVFEAIHKYNKHMGRYQKINSMLSDRVKTIPDLEKPLTDLEIIKPQSFSDILKFFKGENKEDLSINLYFKSGHSYKDGYGYYLMNPVSVNCINRNNVRIIFGTPPK